MKNASSNLHLVFASAAGLIISTASTGHAFMQDDVEAQVRACKAIESDSARLQCFDQIIVTEGNEQAGARSQEAANAPTSTPAAPTPELDEDEFGAEGLRSRIEEREKRSQKQLDTGLLEVGQNRAGKYFFVLNNGQVWRQVQADTRTLLIPRDLAEAKVRIKKKLLGGYILTLDGRSVRVKRIK